MARLITFSEVEYISFNQSDLNYFIYKRCQIVKFVILSGFLNRSLGDKENDSLKKFCACVYVNIIFNFLRNLNFFKEFKVKKFF